MKSNQAALQDKHDGLELRLTAVDSSLSQLPMPLDKVTCPEDKIAALKIVVTQLSDRNDDLENRSRRNMPVKYGLG